MINATLKTLATALILSTAAFAFPSFAAQQGVTGARVTLIEPTYMPHWIAFKIDKPVGACAAGSYLKWSGVGADTATKRENLQAIYAALLTAFGGARLLNLGVDDTDCTVTVFQIM